MGNFLSGALGTNNQVSTQTPSQNIQGYQDQSSQLAGILQAQAAGGGPNPAQQQFLQNSQNIAQQQAATYAGNRALNPGLAARMAGNTAANLQQNAASTAGIQQAQQQLASQGMLGGLLQGQMGAANQASAIQAGIGAGNQGAAQGIVGGILGGGGAALQSALAHGGVVQAYDDGGFVAPSFGSSVGQAQQAPTLGVNTSMSGPATSTGPGASSMAGKFLGGVGSNMSTSSAGAPGMDPYGFLANMQAKNAAGSASLQSGIKEKMAHGGKVPALVSPGEKYLPPSEAKAVADGAKSPMKAGVNIPGKAEVSGDSLKNDKVSAELDEGGVVIPRSVMNSADPEKEAMKFVTKALAKHKKSPEGEFHAALRRTIEGRKNK